VSDDNLKAWVHWKRRELGREKNTYTPEVLESETMFVNEISSVLTELDALKQEIEKLRLRKEVSCAL